VLNGLELDPHGQVHLLTAQQWQRQKRRLDDLGGPPVT
jgi:hypothetical protein